MASGDDKTEFSSKNSTEMSFNSDDQRPEGDRGGNNNRVMVVVDLSIEAKGALQWALSHTVHTQETIILLLLTKPFKHGMQTSLSLSLPPNFAF